MPGLRHCFAIVTVVVAMLFAYAPPVMADALDDALRSGKVGETQRGYIAAVKRPSGAITRLINSINSRRRAQNQSIAKRNNLSLQQVEKLVGPKVINRAPKDTYHQDARGKWRRK